MFLKCRGTRPARWSLLVAIIGAVACGDDGSGPDRTLEFIAQPSSATAGQTIQPPVEVMIRDQNGRPHSGTVTLELDPNPCDWPMGGTLSAVVGDTTARFPDLTLGVVGSGYTLLASSEGATAVSEPFDIVSGVVQSGIELESVLCLKPNPQRDSEDLAYVPEDDGFWSADDDLPSIFEISRSDGSLRSRILATTIVESLPDAGQCDTGDPNSSCSYVDNFELVAYDRADGSLYVVNTVDLAPDDAPAIFRLSKGSCTGCFDAEEWHPLPAGTVYNGLVVADGNLYMAVRNRLYRYDFAAQQIATVDVNGDSLPPTYSVPSRIVGLSYDGVSMWILTKAGTLYQVDWADPTAEPGVHELAPYGLSLPRGLEVVGDTLYVLEGDSPNPLYIFQHLML